MAFHWKDGWLFERTAEGMRIRNDDLFIDVIIPHREWVSILRATDSLQEAVANVAFERGRSKGYTEGFKQGQNSR